MENSHKQELYDTIETTIKQDISISYSFLKTLEQEHKDLVEFKQDNLEQYAATKQELLEKFATNQQVRDKIQQELGAPSGIPGLRKLLNPIPKEVNCDLETHVTELAAILQQLKTLNLNNSRSVNVSLEQVSKVVATMYGSTEVYDKEASSDIKPPQQLSRKI